MLDTKAERLRSSAGNRRVAIAAALVRASGRLLAKHDMAAMRSRSLVITVSVCLAAIAACRVDGAASVPRATFVAALTGIREVPSVTTMASGSATFTLTGSTVAYSVAAAGFTTALTVGHVHFGGSGIVGPVIVPFTIVAQAGVVATGSIDLSAPITFNNITISGDSLRTLFESGRAYVNLHTAAFPGGELRGQIVRQ